MTQEPAPPPSTPRPPARALAVAAVAGLVVGVLVVLGVGALTGGDDDLDLACATLDRIDTDVVFGDDGDRQATLTDVDRVIAAGAVLLASVDDDRESGAGEIGARLQRSIQTLDLDEGSAAYDDAQDYCADH